MKFNILKTFNKGNSARDMAVKGNEYLRNGQYEKALSHYNEALKADPTDTLALCGIGSLRILHDDIDGAIDYYRRALTFDPEYVPGIQKLAWLLNGKKQYDDAIELCDEALRIDPHCAETLSIKGYSYYKLGRYREAIETADRSKELDPGISNIYRRFADKKLEKEAAKEKISQFKAGIQDELERIAIHRAAPECNPIFETIERYLTKPELRQGDMDEILSLLELIKQKVKEKEAAEAKRLEEEKEAKKRANEHLRQVEEALERLRIKGVVCGEESSQIEFFIDDGQYLLAENTAKALLERLASLEELYEKAKTASREIYASSAPVRDFFAEGKYSQIIDFCERRKEIRAIIEKRLEDLETEGFSQEIASIYAKSDIPSTIGEIENDLDALCKKLQNNRDEKIARESLADCQFVLERMNQDSIVLPEDLKNQYENIFHFLNSGEFTAVINESHVLIDELKSCREQFEEARSLVDLVHSPEVDRVFISGDYRKTKKLCQHLREQMDEVISLARSMSEYCTIPEFVQSTIQEEKFEDVEFALSSLKKLAVNAKPELTALLGQTEFRVNTSYHVPIKISNTGLAHARNVKLSFSDEVTTKRVKPVPKVRGGESVETDIAILPRLAGQIALDIVLECTHGPEDTQSTFVKQLWITARDSSSPAPQYPHNPGPEKPPRPPDNQDLEEQLLTQYSDVKFIGCGGFAKVFRAKKHDGSLVAIKIPISRDTETGKAIMREINYWIDLRHNNIVRVFEANIFPIPFFEMELCDSSLDKIKTPMNPDEAAWIIYNICDGLKYAHNQVPPIIHRDLKPQNIMFKDGVAKITDWGMSKSLGVGSTSDGGHIKGTLHYSSPEQIDNKEVDTRTDIWQIGVIFYELVTGKMPFSGNNITQITMNILKRGVDEPKTINPDAAGVNHIIMKCLAKEKSQRYASIEELQNAIATYLNITIRKNRGSINAGKTEELSMLCGKLLIVNLEKGNLRDAYNSAADMLHYSKGDNKNDLKKLCESLKYRIDNGIDDSLEELYEQVKCLLHETVLKNA